MSLQVLHRAGLLDAAPTVRAELTREQYDAFQDRVLETEEYDELPAGDRELLQRAALEVAAGKSDTLRDPKDWGDWPAIDAAIDAEDEDALERALDTVGRGQEVDAAGGDFSKLEPLERFDTDDEPEAAPEFTDDPGDYMDPDESDWVGL